MIIGMFNIKNFYKNKRGGGTSLMGCGCHVSNDQVNNGVGVQNCQRIKNIRVCFVFKSVRGP